MSAPSTSVAPPRPSERETKDFDPVGGRIGSFFLYPTLETRLEYDDNILALPDEGSGDVELTLRGALALESRWERHSLQIDGYVEQNFHGKFATEDVMEGGGRVRGTLVIDRDTSARLVASIDALAEDRAGQIWIACEEGLLLRFTSTRFSVVSPAAKIIRLNTAFSLNC